MEEAENEEGGEDVLGLSGYDRRFIPQYSVIAAVLTDLTRKDRPKLVRWTEECEEAFERLKEVLCNDPALKSPDYSREFTVQTDASDRGMGVVLCQTNKDGEEDLVAYFSRKFLPKRSDMGWWRMSVAPSNLGFRPS